MVYAAVMHGRRMRLQLKAMAACEAGVAAERGFVSVSADLDALSGRLGLAGYLTHAGQRRVLSGIFIMWCVGAGILLSATVLLEYPMLFYAVVTAIYSYLFLCGVLLYLRARAAQFRRELLFYLPLTLEQLLLLVHSGMGLVPAVRELVTSGSANPVTPFLALTYERAQSGETYEQALAAVAEQCPFVPLRHFFLHLETSIALGAELSHALRQLSDHIHSEWHVTLEGIVRRLESAVVFPVFIAVIGLLLLVAAVPVVPLLELSESMKRPNRPELLQPVLHQPGVTRE